MWKHRTDGFAAGVEQDVKGTSGLRCTGTAMIFQFILFLQKTFLSFLSLSKSRELIFEAQCPRILCVPEIYMCLYEKSSDMALGTETSSATGCREDVLEELQSLFTLV